tara:strand:- start:23 stop:208 length:186 start_codon:yes stop_codon:yes gene_type:complete
VKLRFLAIGLVKLVDKSLNLLRSGLAADQHRIFGLDDDQIMDADCGDQAVFAVDMSIVAIM